MSFDDDERRRQLQAKDEECHRANIASLDEKADLQERYDNLKDAVEIFLNKQKGKLCTDLYDLEFYLLNPHISPRPQHHPKQVWMKVPDGLGGETMVPVYA